MLGRKHSCYYPTQVCLVGKRYYQVSPSKSITNGGANHCGPDHKLLGPIAPPRSDWKITLLQAKLFRPAAMTWQTDATTAVWHRKAVPDDGLYPDIMLPTTATLPASPGPVSFLGLYTYSRIPRVDSLTASTSPWCQHSKPCAEMEVMEISGKCYRYPTDLLLPSVPTLNRHRLSSIVP